MKNFFKKNREIIAYVFFGVITTAVSMGVYFTILTVAENIGGISPEESIFNAVRVIAQILQWIAGVLVAFFTNKKWVFCVSGTTKKQNATELSKFAVGRLATLGLDSLLTFGTVWILNALNYVPFTIILTFTADIWSKIVSSVVVIITNYVISKFIVFKR